MDEICATMVPVVVTDGERMDRAAIGEFKDSFAFLSNMYVVPGGITFVEDGAERRAASSEHIYMMNKFSDSEHREQVLAAAEPRLAKKLARKFERAHVSLTYDPDDPLTKLPLMEAALRWKFAPGTAMARLLLATGDRELVEGNNRNDLFWGRSLEGDHDGENHLGQLLTQRRNILRLST